MLDDGIACRKSSKEAKVTGPEHPDEPAMSLAGLPPTARQRRQVFAAGAFLFVAFAIMLVIAFVLMFFLGTYTYPVHDETALAEQPGARLPSDA